jgi:uncharacterized protein
MLSIFELHQKYYNNQPFFEIVWVHCNIVKDFALQIADRLEDQGIKVDKKLLETGALVHDIGAYKCFDEKQKLIKPYIQHGILGEKILTDEGFPKELVRFASHHTGVGITKKDIEKQNLPLPKKDFIPESLEEEIVTFCDKFHSKTNPPKYDNYEEIIEELSQFGENKVKKFKNWVDKFGLPSLQT